jgi:branched-chain amino acid transport system ATP-binding protein
MAILEAKSITKYFGGLAAVKDVSFEVAADEILGIIGPNGAGKTTIFNLITRCYPLTHGEIVFDNKKISSGYSTHVIIKLGIGRTFQKPKPLSRMTVLENLMTSAFVRTANIGEAREGALKVLEFTEFVDKSDVLASSLTIADRKKLEISRALATKPKLLLLDEVAAGLNPKEMLAIIKLIEKIRERGITIIAIEHVMKFIMSVSDRILVLHHGNKIAEGLPQKVANNKAVIDAYLGESYA